MIRNHSVTQDFNFFIDNSMKEPKQLFTQPSMIDLVKMTVNQSSDASNGFLLLFIGETISELLDPNSNLGESLQYVLDHVNENNTLVIVSGSCPKSVKKVENEDMEAEENNFVPMYVIGEISILLN